MLPGQQGLAVPAEIQQIISAYQMGRITLVGVSKRGQCYLCEHGLISKEGNAPAQPLPWDQILVVWRQTKATYTWWSTNKRMIVTTTCIVQRTDGYTFSLDRSFHSAASLYKGIEDGTKRVLFPAALQRYMQGQLLAFGSLLVSLQGISKGREWLAWTQIASVKVEVLDQEVVVVKQLGTRHAWAKVETSTIPNLHVFLALVEHAQRSPGGSVVAPPSPPQGQPFLMPAALPGGGMSADMPVAMSPTPSASFSVPTLAPMLSPGPASFPTFQAPPQKHSRRNVLIALGTTLAGLTAIGGTLAAIVIHINDINEQHRKANAAFGTPIPLLYQDSYIYDIAWSPDGKRIAAGVDQGTALIWNPSDTSHPLICATGSGLPIAGVSWSPDSRHLVAGYNPNQENGPDVMIWDAQNGKKVAGYNTIGYTQLAKGSVDEVGSVAWSHHGQYILAAGEVPQAVFQIDARNGNLVNEFTFALQGTCPKVAWSPDDQWLAYATTRRGVVFVLSSVDVSYIFRYIGHTSQVNDLTWSPDGKRIASAGSDKTVQVWNAHDGSDVFSYRGHTDAVRGVAWSPDGKRIASCGDDLTLQVWDAMDGSHVFTFMFSLLSNQSQTLVPKRLAWSPDGTRIVVAGAGMQQQLAYIFQAPH